MMSSGAKAVTATSQYRPMTGATASEINRPMVLPWFVRFHCHLTCGLYMLATGVLRLTNIEFVSQGTSVAVCITFALADMLCLTSSSITVGTLLCSALGSRYITFVLTCWQLELHSCLLQSASDFTIHSPSVRKQPSRTAAPISSFLPLRDIERYIPNSL